MWRASLDRTLIAPLRRTYICVDLTSASQFWQIGLFLTMPHIRYISSG